MIKKLCEIPSPSGDEEKMKEFIVNELSRFADLYFEDSFGNLIFVKKGEGASERICIECGMDECFLMVSDAEEKISFTAPPHIKASVFSEKNICFADGSSALIKSEKEENIKAADLYAEPDSRKRRTGEYACLLPCFKKDEDKFSAENLRYKIPIYVLINGLKTIKKNKAELYFVFSVQKCLASRGVKALMQSGIDFDKAVSVSCIDENADGVLVMAKEKSCVLSPKIRKEIMQLTEKNNIPASLGFTEENFYMKTYLAEGRGTPCALICIPCTDNTVMIKDIKVAEKLITAVCERQG